MRGHELAMVPPLPDVGMNGWHASPSCKIRPLGDVHCGCGPRHTSFQFTQRLSGVFVKRAEM